MWIPEIYKMTFKDRKEIYRPIYCTKFHRLPYKTTLLSKIFNIFPLSFINGALKLPFN